MSVGKRAGCSRSVGLFAAFAWLMTGAILVDPALAGSFKVNPVHINLPADRQTASLTITNSDAVPVSVRVIALEWTQVDGTDVHSPTSNVIASPPIFTIPAGKTQLVRPDPGQPAPGPATVRPAQRRRQGRPQLASLA